MIIYNIDPDSPPGTLWVLGFVTVAERLSAAARPARGLKAWATFTKPTCVGYPIIFLTFISSPA
jgi:hypothetical protein